MLVFSERQRTFEGLEAVVREAHNVGGGLQRGDCKKITEKKVPLTILKKISSPETKSFA